MLWEFVSECDCGLPRRELASVTDGSLRITMLLTRLSVFGTPFAFSLPFPLGMVSLGVPSSPPVNHPSPRVYGLASGDPLTLSMLSSRRGALVAGYVGACGGKTGLKVAFEGTRWRCDWA